MIASAYPSLRAGPKPLLYIIGETETTRDVIVHMYAAYYSLHLGS